jgi:tRNA G10  N-methylase Trm11
MRMVCRKIGEPSIILDPFTGSGTTGIACVLEGASFIGFEENDGYAEIARARIAYFAAHGEAALELAAVVRTGDRQRKDREAAGQMDLLGGWT